MGDAAGLKDGDEITVGMVSAPALGRRWWAARGHGAFVDDGLSDGPRQIHVSAVHQLGDAQLCFPGLDDWGEGLDGFMRLAGQCWRSRGFGDFWAYMLVAEGAAEIACEPIVSLVGPGRAAGDRRGGRRDGSPTLAARVLPMVATRSPPTAGCMTRRWRSSGAKAHTSHMERLFGEEEPASWTQTAPAGADVPLAARMRPHTLDEFVGQQRLLGAGSALRTAIEEGRRHSMILHGPPGSGKTTLARIIAEASGAAFEEESAVQAGRAEVRAVIERARERLRSSGKKTLFFLDEIHRFNKAQQDALLPAVEEGLVTLIGATTENPYFEVNSALISRTHVYELEALGPADIRVLLERAVARGECGPPERVQPEVLDFLAERSGGDARTALNGLELACDVRRTRGAGDARARRGCTAAARAAL